MLHIYSTKLATTHCLHSRSFVSISTNVANMWASLAFKIADGEHFLTNIFIAWAQFGDVWLFETWPNSLIVYRFCAALLAMAWCGRPKMTQSHVAICGSTFCGPSWCGLGPTNQPTSQAAVSTFSATGRSSRAAPRSLASLRTLSQNLSFCNLGKLGKESWRDNFARKRKFRRKKAKLNRSSTALRCNYRIAIAYTYTWVSPGGLRLGEPYGANK